MEFIQVRQWITSVASQSVARGSWPRSTLVGTKFDERMTLAVSLYGQAMTPQF